MSLAIVGIIFYILSAVGLILVFTNKTKYSPNIITLLGVIGLAFHLHFVVSHYNINNENAFSLLLATNLMAVLVSFIAVAFALVSKNLFTLPVNYLFSAFILLVSQFIPVSAASFATWSYETLGHISLAIISYAILLIATFISLQYSLISYRLKHHDLSVLSLPMPSLVTIEKQIIGLLKLGVVLLSCSIATGFIFLDQFLNSGQAHKVILSIIAWVCFTIALIGHAKIGWRGRSLMILTCTGSILLSLGYFASRFIKEILLT